MSTPGYGWGNLGWPQVGEFQWPPGFGAAGAAPQDASSPSAGSRGSVGGGAALSMVVSFSVGGRCRVIPRWPVLRKDAGDRGGIDSAFRANSVAELALVRGIPWARIGGLILNLRRRKQTHEGRRRQTEAYERLRNCAKTHDNALYAASW